VHFSISPTTPKPSSAYQTSFWTYTVKPFLLSLPPKQTSRRPLYHPRYLLCKRARRHRRPNTSLPIPRPSRTSSRRLSSHALQPATALLVSSPRSRNLALGGITRRLGMRSLELMRKAGRLRRRRRFCGGVLSWRIRIPCAVGNVLPLVDLCCNERCHSKYIDWEGADIQWGLFVEK
jgi:hypothetical protein